MKIDILMLFRFRKKAEYLKPSKDGFDILNLDIHNLNFEQFTAYKNKSFTLLNSCQRFGTNEIFWLIVYNSDLLDGRRFNIDLSNLDNLVIRKAQKDIIITLSHDARTSDKAKERLLKLSSILDERKVLTGKQVKKVIISDKPI